MKKYILSLSIVVGVFLFTGCLSTNEIVSVKTKNDSQIVDWSNKNLDMVAKPEWLKKLVCGNSSLFKEEFGVEKDAIVKYGVASTSSRDSSLAASRVNYNAMRAEELRTKVVSEAASTLNDEGATEACSNAAILAKVDLSGHELIAQFWQKVDTTDKETDTVETEYICYSVYKISKESWANTLKGFLAQIIPSVPDSQAQIKMAESIQSLYDDTTAEKELAANVALAQFKAQEEEAKARVAEAEAKTQSTVVAQTTKNDVDWMSVLSAGAELLLK